MLRGPSKSAPRSNNPYFRKGEVTTTTIGLISVVSGYVSPDSSLVSVIVLMSVLVY